MAHRPRWRARYLNKAKAFTLNRSVAALSIWAMALLADITRVERAYYGPDTRAFGLLLGAGWRSLEARTPAAPARHR